MVSPVSSTLTIVNRKGLHARASAQFVKCVECFDADVLVSRDGQEVGGDSIMGLMMLGASQGLEIDLVCQGSDAEQVMAALTALVEAGFGETD